MFPVYLLMITTLFFSACATTPSFQKGSGGYFVENLNTQDHFRISTELSPEATDKFVEHYGDRAVGEECLERGFQFFDVGVLGNRAFEGFCFPSAIRKSLAITFKKEGFSLTPPHFIVENLNNKSSTQLQINDEVLLIDGKTLTSMAQIKSLIFVAATHNKSSLPLKIRRLGKELTLIEPIADLKNGLYSQEDLGDLRRIVK